MFWVKPPLCRLPGKRGVCQVRLILIALFAGWSWSFCLQADPNPLVCRLILILFFAGWSCPREQMWTPSQGKATLPCTWFPPHNQPFSSFINCFSPHHPFKQRSNKNEQHFFSGSNQRTRCAGPNSYQGRHHNNDHDYLRHQHLFSEYSIEFCWYGSIAGWSRSWHIYK